MNKFGFLTILFALVPLVVTGCMPGGGGGSDDRDDDLLSNEFEAQIGSDPDNADTDGDGFDDGHEYVNYFSPTKDDDHPYTNSDYPRGPLPDSDTWSAMKDEAEADEDMGRGWAPGNFSKNFDVIDQYGDSLKLKRFFGEVIVIDVSAEWCPPCRVAAMTWEDEWHELGPEGSMFFTLLGDGLSNGDSEAARWAEWPTGEFDGGDHPYGHPSQYGEDPTQVITAAIVEDGSLDDTAREISDPLIGQTGGYPTFAILGRDHTIRSVASGAGPGTMEMVRELVEEERPEVDYPLPENVDEIRDAYAD